MKTVIEKIGMKNIKNLAIIFCIIMFFEIFIFNYNSLRTIFGNYEKIVCDNPEFLYVKEEKAYYMIKDINVKTASVKIELDDLAINNNKKFDGREYATEYTVAYSDATTDEFFKLASKVYIPENEKSKIMPLYLSGNTKSLLISVNEFYSENDLVKSIIINERIPFQISFMRVCGLLLLAAFIMYLKNEKSFDETYNVKKFKHEAILLCVVGVFFIVLTIINSYSQEELNSTSTNFLLSLISTDEGIYNKEFVDAIKVKSLYLLEDPSEEFINLENQYDPLGRTNVERGIDYKWDTAYYKGHQYIYFGILPLLVFFLPYNLLTGAYLKISVVVYILSIAILILLKEIFLKVIKLFFEEVPFRLVFTGLIMLCSGSLVLYANGMSRVYELVIIAGFYTVLQGMYFILKSLEEDKNRYLNISLGSLFLALSVACRPTCLFVSIIIIPYLLNLFIKNIKENKKDLIKLILGVAIPYLTVGILLMIYNYARFENPFDFGTKYQITINNMMELGNRIYAVPTGIMCNLFNLPRFTGSFPFIINNNELMTFYGYYYIENMIAGVFIIAPICFMNFLVFKSRKKIENKSLKILIYISIVVAIFIAILSVMMAGSNERYLIDYAWIFVLTGILISIVYYKTLQTEEAKKIINKILAIVTIYTFIFAIITGIVSEKEYLKNKSPETYFKIRYTICFWE